MRLRYRKYKVQLKTKFSYSLVIKFKRMNGVGNVARGVETENLTERDHLEDIDINGRIILKRIFKKEHQIVDWTALIHDWNMWRFVNAVKKFRDS